LKDWQSLKLKDRQKRKLKDWQKRKLKDWQSLNLKMVGVVVRSVRLYARVVSVVLKMVSVVEV
jgi:hypothetical protein